MNFELLAAGLLGLGLAAAAGLRVFLPLLIAGLAARLGHLELAGGFAWLTSTPALVAFAGATVLEIAAYQIPWLDHLLDVIATPLAAVAGTLIMAATLLDLGPAVRWPLAIIAGGGVASLVQAATVGVRLASTTTTGGLGNPAVAAGETGGSAGLGLLAILVPVVAGLVVLGLIAVAVATLRRARR
ncbi:MAG TPA: DUF4126 domain-containing protein [Candidatus Krumholzibacteria bacterium]|nr:DUF4126 domain-containing protein [Candidatus Krumholzibacteria bacterium]HPD70757.1 DUF4126 domain-containing protein [Candidatus Krumholzibacteria bacterium]HRY39543.1 DUF4126 domain-containing protein [Candidatus Krumholzibacteria bacterium]